MTASRSGTELANEEWRALTDAHQLENAILNLAINARDAMSGSGTLSVATTRETLESKTRVGQEDIEPGDYIVISVGDTGAGMSAETLAKVFEPFFTTKPIGQGTGLGLSMIYGFAKQSRGHVRIDSVEGQGTTVKLYLPRYLGAIVEAAIVPERVAATGAGENVLLIEDDSGVRLIISNVLRDLGYSCIEAAHGDAALPMLTSNTPLDLLITDVGLPGMNGRQIAEIARRHRPRAQDPVRHRLRRERDRAGALPRTGDGNDDQAIFPRRSCPQDSRDDRQVIENGQPTYSVQRYTRRG